MLEAGWLAAFLERSHLPVPTSVLALVGTGFVILDAFAFASTVRTRYGTTDPELDAAFDSRLAVEAQGDDDDAACTTPSVLAAQRASGAVALLRRAAPAAPAVTLVRVGDSGVELLLDAEAPASLPGFEQLETARTCRLMEDDLEGERPGDVELEELGSDEDGTYFTPRDEVEGVVTRLVVVADGDDVVVEPYGGRVYMTWPHCDHVNWPHPSTEQRRIHHRMFCSGDPVGHGETDEGGTLRADSQGA